MGKTLKVVQYRGSCIYIRFIINRHYEVLVVFKGRIFCHAINIEKTGNLEKRLTRSEVEAGAIDACLRAGIQMVDNFKEEFKFSKVVQNVTKQYIKQWQEKWAKKKESAKLIMKSQKEKVWTMLRHITAVPKTKDTE